MVESNFFALVYSETAAILMTRFQQLSLETKMLLSPLFSYFIIRKSINWGISCHFCRSPEIAEILFLYLAYRERIVPSVRVQLCYQFLLRIDNLFAKLLLQPRKSFCFPTSYLNLYTKIFA